MSVRRYEDWGERGALPDDGALVSSDAEARALVETARRVGEEPPPIGLLGGDLCRTLGGRGDVARIRSDEGVRLRIDLGRVVADDRPPAWFVAHLVTRAGPLWGRAWVAMNAEWCGRWCLGPRAHPGDGLLDFSEADLPLGERLRARSRLPSGAHLPHPQIRTWRAAAAEVRFERPVGLWLDGSREGRVSVLTVTLEPGALLVVV